MCYIFFASGFLHGHVSYLSDDCQACLLLLTVDRDVFFTLSEAKQKIVEVRTKYTKSLVAESESSVFIKAENYHWTIFCITSIQYTPTQRIFMRFIIMLTSKFILHFTTGCFSPTSKYHMHFFFPRQGVIRLYVKMTWKHLHAWRTSLEDMLRCGVVWLHKFRLFMWVLRAVLIV
jgi:hypothetical protein